MNDDFIRNRYLFQKLPSSNQRRLVLITGARQTGKTTLVELVYPDLKYLNLDAFENREFIRSMPTTTWSKNIGAAVIDEAQKEPIVFEKIKYAFDARELDFSVLLGSSQILLLQKIRESLAGRIAIYELYPLMMAEIYTKPYEKLFPPLIERILLSDEIDLILNQEPDMLLPTEAAAKKESQDYLLQWGGMPALLRLAGSERNKWIKDYEYTYLERDLADLSRLNDLQPFRKFQKLSALRTGKLLNYSELARDSGISVDTARRYLEYLKLSYQIILLQPYYCNLTSALVKTPKLYWLDMGIVRNLAGTPINTTSGELYETMVVSELFKCIKTQQMDVELYFYRTHSGSEVDLLLQLRNGVIGIEIKSHTNVIKKDFRQLKEISSKLKAEWLGGIVIYNGDIIKRIAEPNIWAIPSWRLFT